MKTRFFYLLIALPLIIIAIFVITIDPFFHYHKPIKGLPYILSDERYQNDGIVKHFDYEAIISGSSVTENFRASEVDELWNTKTVKTCFAGGRYSEVDGIINTALENNKNIKYVIRGLDLSWINTEPDVEGYDNTPKYLYNNNPFDDYEYIFNIDVLMSSGNLLIRKMQGKEMTSFDDYSAWYMYKESGKEAVLSSFERQPKSNQPPLEFTKEDEERIRRNIQTNVLNTALKYPDVTFYLFLPPYNVCYYDALVRTNSMEYTKSVVETMASMLVEQPNIELYGFSDEYWITTDLDYYLDVVHYDERINSYMLKCMSEGKNRLDNNNYSEYFEKEYKYYSSYNYEPIFE